MTDERLYQPALLWAKFKTYAQSIADKPSGRNLELYIYRKDKPGAYFLREGGKLYWDEVVGDGYFSNCGQDELFENREQLGEVTALGIGRDRGPMLLANNFSDFLKLLEGEKTMQLTAAEQIAERIEEVVMDARAKGVNVYAFVHGGAQGGVYVTDEKIKSLLGVIRKTLDDIEQTDDEALRSFGSISYGL